MMRTPRQLAADWGNRQRAAIRKARWCVLQAKRMRESFGDHARAEVYMRLARSWVVDARANNHRRVSWLRRARERAGK